MAQALATRSIHSSLASLSSGSLHSRVEKIRTSDLASKTSARKPRKSHKLFRVTATRSASEVVPVSPEDVQKTEEEQMQLLRGIMQPGDTPASMWSKPTVRRKTKIVCTIGPSTNTREMIWKLAEEGMNVARLNMSHGDHSSHQKVIDLVKEYNAQSKDNVIAIMLDTKGPEVRSGDLPQPIALESGQEFTFTIRRGVGTADCVSVNYDDFVNDVEVGDMLLVDGGMMSFVAMVARGDLGAELPIEEVPLLQEEIIRICRSMGKAVIVATNMLESMIVHPTPTRAEVSDIAIAVREGADAVMLSGETAHGKFPLKAVKVMHTVALRTEATLVGGETPSNLGQAFKNHMSEMFAFHATMMSNTLGTSIVVFTRTGFMAILQSHYRPSGTIFAFTNEKRIQQRLALYQGVCPIYMEFSDDAEGTFANALALLQCSLCWHCKY
ncbi:plastidic pyruvate kinase beta subunit 1 [Actinidia rufa]|uniref:pyruvate kinase n=1 Tax=Actinidia rufa TaxID=165716 RepID=A0A7J0G6J2_9ERIC|nr:plastidic pyruvate kinase beta subunit 1 [Actinidia rufa]